jgi:hypothetical protein
MELRTDRYKLKELFPDRAKKYAQKLHVKADEIDFIRKGIPIEPASISIEEGERAAIRYVTTPRLDRDNEILLPDGAILDDFRQSPSVLYAHDYHGLPIGKDVWIKPGKGGILAKTVYANHAFAEDVFQCVKGGFLNSNSVGFIPLEAVTPNDKESFGLMQEMLEKDYNIPRDESGRAKTIYTRWIMLEHSDVPVASNASSLNVLVAKGEIILNDRLKKDLGVEDVPDFQEPTELADDIIEKQEAEVVTCQNCGKQFDYSKESEIAMGWIKCPECETVINQNGEVAKDGEISPEGQVSADAEIGGKDEIITKPEETDDYIHIPVRDKGDFVDASFRTIDISAEKGIKAVIGKLKSDPQGSAHVQKYLFKKSEGWTMESAQAWIKEHEKGEAEAGQTGEKMPRKQYKERWNKSLSGKFDVDITPERPAARFEYELFTGFLGCKIKDIFKNGFLIPSPLLGTYLMGFEQAVKDFKLKDIRNFTYEGRESPPEYEVLTLNTKMGDKEFLIEGVSFYEADKGNVVLQFEPCWRGINVSFITHLEKREWNRDLMKKVHDWAEANNLLKNEKFALNGEFLKPTEDDWDSLILEPDIKNAIRKTVNYFDENKEKALSRGLLLVGEPGTGKTKTGRVLMNGLDTTFIWASSRDFKHYDPVGSFVLAFELARDLAPTVLFIEDIDTWLSEYAIDVLKTELDGLKQNKGFLTILTSNYPERLPDALLDRPGRFHHVVDFPLPKAEQRKEMLAKWAGELGDAVLDSIVAETAGYSGAHMKELVDFANILAAEEKIEIGEALLRSLERLKKQRELIMAIREERRGKGLEPEDKDAEGTDSEPKEQVDMIVCECISCGHKQEMEAGQHCQDIKCPKCGGEMRRAERPGPGKEAADFEPKEQIGDENPATKILTLAVSEIQNMKAEIAEMKEGRVLSTNRKLISEAITQMKEAIEALEKLLTATEPVSDDGDGGETKATEETAEVKQAEQGKAELREAITTALADFFKNGAFKEALQELVTDEIDRIRGKVR